MDYVEKSAAEAEVLTGLNAFFSGEQQPEAKPAEPVQGDPAQPQQDTAEKPEEQPAVDSPVNDDEAEGEIVEGEEPAAEPEAEGTDEATEPQEPKGHYNVTNPDGTTSKVSFDELKSGYLRQADYSRKAQEVAEQRKAVVAEAEHGRQQTIQVLTALQHMQQKYNPVNILQARLNEAKEIGDSDTVNLILHQIRDVKEEIRNVDNALRWEQDQASTQKTEQEKVETQSFLKEQKEALYTRFPSLDKPEGQKKFNDTVVKAMQKLGRNPADVKKPYAADAAAYYYAGKYFESLDAKPQVAEKLKGKAVMPKPGGRNSDAKGAKLNAAFDQFNKTPSRDSLAALIGASGV
jgi:hypothetical protein